MKTMAFQIQYISIIITCCVTKMQAFFLKKFLLNSYSLFEKIIYFFFQFFFFFFLSFTFSPLNFFLLFFVPSYFLLLFITIFFLLFFIFLSSSFFSLNMNILCPTFGYCTNHPKKIFNTFCFKCGYCKISLTQLMFIL